MKMLFDTETTGHHIEYIHHLYMMMLGKKSDEYVIVVPDEFTERRTQYEWPEAKHIHIDYIASSRCQKFKNSCLILSAYQRAKLLHFYVKKYHVSHVLLITLINFIPFLPFLISRKVSVTGIIYKIYLYEWANYSIWKKLVEIIKYKIIAANNCIRNVMVLNDRPAAYVLNRLYNTQKFKYLVDPYNETTYKPKDIRDEFNIPSCNKLFLHMGSMNRRKGTLNILQALALLSKDSRNHISLVIAGKVRDDIKKEFYALLDHVKSSCQIIVFDQYCSREFIADLCYSCDFVLIPYEKTSQSSGLIAHASYYHKPVIGSCSGLIGKLVRRYKLGFILNDTSATCLAETIEHISLYRTNSSYCNIVTISNFQHQLGLFF